MPKTEMKFYLKLIVGTCFGLWVQGCTNSMHTGETELSSNSAEGLQSVAIYEITLKPILTANCQSCHGGTQSPLFIKGDSNSSHDALFSFNLVSLDFPTSSRLVSKINAGHKGFSSILAAQIEQAITDWSDQIIIGGGTPPQPPVLEATFASIQNLILIPKCVGCHSPTGSRPQEDYSNYNSTIKTGGIDIGNAIGSAMYEECFKGSMPENAAPLSGEELTTLADWINNGAVDN